MTEFEIRFKSVQQVQTFVSIATTKAYQIQVMDKHNVVNGKSFMEMFCLNIKAPLTVQVHSTPEQAEAFRLQVAEKLNSI